MFARLTTPTLAILAIFAANPLSACSVCFAADRDTLIVYQASTAFLTLFPLFLIFGGLWLLRRFLRKKFYGA